MTSSWIVPTAANHSPRENPITTAIPLMQHLRRPDGSRGGTHANPTWRRRHTLSNNDARAGVRDSFGNVRGDGGKISTGLSGHVSDYGCRQRPVAVSRVIILSHDCRRRPWLRKAWRPRG